MKYSERGFAPRFFVMFICLANRKQQSIRGAELAVVFGLSFLSIRADIAEGKDAADEFSVHIDRR